MSLRRILAAAVALALAAPGIADAQTTTKKVRAHDLLSYNLDLNVSPGGSAFVTNSGLTVRRVTTTQRNAITCNASTEGQLVYNSSTDALNACISSAWTALASGSASTLNAAYLAGASIDLTNAQGPVAIDDDQTGAGSAIDIDGDGLVAGATTHSYLDLASAVAHTTTGTVRGLLLDLSGATVAGGTLEGMQITMASSAQDALDVTVGGIDLDSGDLSVTFTEGSNAIDVVTGDARVQDGSFLVTDDDNAASLGVTNNTATTVGAAAAGGVVQASSTSLTTGAMFSAATAEVALAGGFYYSAWDTTAAARVWSIGEDGAQTIAGSAAGTDALTLTAGDILLTAGHIDLTLGNLTLTDGDITVSAGLVAVTQNQTGAAAFSITANGARTEDVVQIDSNSTGNVPIFDINLTGALGASGHLFDVDLTGAAASNVLDADVGAVLYTGDLINLDLGATSTTGQAMTVVGGAAARTTNLIAVNDDGTNAGDSLEILGGGGTGTVVEFGADIVGSKSILTLDYGAASTGTALLITMDQADNTANALVLTGNGGPFSDALVEIGSGVGAFTDDVVELNISGAGSGNGIDATVSAAQTGDVIQIAYTAAATGEAIEIAMANAAADAGAIDINDGARATTVDVVAITDSSTSTADSLAIAKTGAASTGSAVELSGTVVAADAGDGKLLQVSYNGALVSQGGGGAAASGTSVVNLEAITTAWANDVDNTPSFVLNVVGAAAGAAGDNDHAVRIAATGADIEGLWVDDGTSRFDESVTVGVDGTGAAAFTYEKTAAGVFTIDASTVTSTVDATAISFASATASTEALAISLSNIANVDSVAGLVVAGAGTMTALGAGISQPNIVSIPRGNAADNAGAIRTAYSAATPSVASGGITAAFAVNSGYTAGLAFADHAGTITEINTAGAASGITISGAAGVTAGAGGPITITGGAGTAGAGAAVTISGGAGDAANAGGVLTLRAGTNAAGGTEANVVVRGSDDASGFEDWLVINANASPPVQVANSARPTKTEALYGSDFAAVTGTPVFAEAGTTEIPELLFDGAATERGCAPWAVPWDWASGTDIDVDLEYTSETGASNIVWALGYQCEADSGALAAAGDTSITCTTDTVDIANSVNVLDCGTDLLSANLGAAGRFCKVCVQRNGGDVGDTHAADAGLLRLRFNYTALTP